MSVQDGTSSGPTQNLNSGRLMATRTPESRAYLEHFKNSEYFTCLGDVRGYREIDEMFLQGEAKIALIIPEEYARELLAGRSAKVQILVDGSDANTAGQAVAK